MANEHDEQDDGNPLDYLNDLFPWGRIVELLEQQGYTDVQAVREGKTRYRFTMHKGDDPVTPVAVEQQLAEIVERATDAKWHVELSAAVVDNQKIAVTLKVAHA